MPLKSTLWIEMELPIRGERPRRFAARVIQRFEPQAVIGEGRNLLSGMAVQFLEPEKVLEELRPLLDPPGRLAEMAAAARSVGRPDAASAVADLIEEHAR